MKLHKLKLANIGAFYGEYEFDLFSNETSKNVILFGGQNGSGKTTILEAIRLALFGPLAFGYKTDTSTYYEKINTKLNTIAQKQERATFRIELFLEVVENLKTKNYTIIREWKRIVSHIREEVLIKLDGMPLDERESEIFQTKLREENPPQLFELCLFDGERIAQIISDEILSSYLKDAAKVMFNLDLFENLETDLSNLIRQDSIYGSLSNEEKLLFETKQNLEELTLREEALIFEQEQITQRLEETESILSESKKQFEVHGGLIKERRDELLSKMSALDKKRTKMMEKTKEAVTTLLPFVLVKDLVEDVSQQMKNEAVHEIRNNVSEMLTSSHISQLVDKLTEKKMITTEVPKDKISEQLFQGFLDLLSPNDTEEQPLHRASSQQRAELDLLLQQVVEFNADDLLKSYKTNVKWIKEIQDIRKQIDENDADDLINLSETISKLQIEITKLQAQQDHYSDELLQLATVISDQQHNYEQLKAKVVRAKKAENVFIITNRVLDVSRSFRFMQIRKKLQEVEWQATKMLQSLFRKELFISKVSIDPDTFQLRLYNTEHEEINKDILSAGEKQILLLSIVWAMVKCSKKRVPFVFDTLLGRLDQTHRKSLIQNLVPNCGEQVIILATDSEINEEDYKVFQPQIARTYTIDFNTSTSTVDVSTNYFMYSNQEVTKRELSPQDL
ncbi:DNA sulfur modification protein DndD [Tumebacillus flagellatus]|uniref:Nuclease SbcCD subunit C n=1 Tax=Tumebacillus flagellatus TaxID=1157490 RepID=A0A074LXA4_9BACL|nr:DNA sulfur modification protein DndD [Tumebacillus flagellatus]KEO84703.1 hypothetical protein EL26_04075 [Tumebacillus flagellatus]